MSETKPVRSNFDEAIISAHSILSLLEHRGIVDSQWNREDVAKAAEKLAPYAKVAERRPLTADPAAVEITKCAATGQCAMTCAEAVAALRQAIAAYDNYPSENAEDDWPLAVAVVDSARGVVDAFATDGAP